MTASTPENVQTVEYNARRMVKKVTFTTNNNSYAEYFYNDQGQKYKTKYTDRSNLGNIVYKITWYAFNGAAIYEEETAVSNNVNMKEQTVGGIAGRMGVLYNSNNEVNYELTDHLRNVRATVKYAGVSGTKTVSQATYWADYYAFGGVMPGRNYTLNAYRYAYQGNENDVDLSNNTDWTSFELRLHNNDLGRWMAPDPYGQFYSPYISMGDNPVSGIDPDGGYMTSKSSSNFEWNRTKIRIRYEGDYFWNNDWPFNVNDNWDIVGSGENKRDWIGDDAITLNLWASITPNNGNESYMGDDGTVWGQLRGYSGEGADGNIRNYAQDYETINRVNREWRLTQELRRIHGRSDDPWWKKLKDGFVSIGEMLRIRHSKYKWISKREGSKVKATEISVRRRSLRRKTILKNRWVPVYFATSSTVQPGTIQNFSTTGGRIKVIFFNPPGDDNPNTVTYGTKTSTGGDSRIFEMADQGATAGTALITPSPPPLFDRNTDAWYLLILERQTVQRRSLFKWHWIYD